MRYLIDTNVISELRKGTRADPGVRRWIEETPADALYLSVLTLGEIRRGIENIRRRDSTAAVALEAWLLKLLAVHADRILPIDEPIAQEWGRSNVPDPLPVIDGLLAATAKVHRMTIVTRNVGDLGRSGALLLDPFTTRG